mgnify:CR=1 FL=1
MAGCVYRYGTPTGFEEKMVCRFPQSRRDGMSEESVYAPAIWVLRGCRRVDTRRYRYVAPPELEEGGVTGCVYRYCTPTGFEEKMKMVCRCSQPRRGGMPVDMVYAPPNMGFVVCFPSPVGTVYR